MTTSPSLRAPAGAPPGARPPLLTRLLLLRFATIVGASVSFFLLLSVAPLYATTRGGDAGLTTGALMLATMCGELATPWLVARYGYRLALSVGLVLLGAPALVLTASGGMAWIVAVCAARGLGFALTVVAGGALTASLIPAERRSEGLALAGIVSSVPSLIGLPLGVWLATRVGYPPVCVAAGAAALAALVVVPGLPGRERAGAEGGTGRGGGGEAGTGKGGGGVVAGFRDGGLARPGLVFTTTAVGSGIIVTFLPLALPASTSGLVTAALFVQPAASTAAIWCAGRIGDRRGPAALVVPGLLLSAGGLLLTALTGSAVAVLAGVAVFGVGFGVSQNATLSLMYARVPRSGYGTVSALWNFGWDAGMGAGAVGYGALAARTGYPSAFALTSAAMLAALVPALRDRRRARSGGQPAPEGCDPAPV